MSKKSQFLTQAKQSKFEGDPALLHAMIRDHGLDMSSIGKLSVDEVKKFAQTVGIPTSRKSRVC
ncbi:hypothetical protein OS493_012316 [Desmophyllum pertusum]|uniref:Uncharacterized protein n=1 Tax=Desmophyllum pertusum TaxID=174260 RepID=A0A9W9ZQC7_9CNID|nr:hypothetical protein OS493_012316 [Desmophyllum pertusum]